MLNKWESDFSDLYQAKHQWNNEKFCDDIKMRLEEMEYLQMQPEYQADVSLNKSISAIEVRKAIIKARQGKASGIDNLPYEVYKNEAMTEQMY